MSTPAGDAPALILFFRRGWGCGDGATTRPLTVWIGGTDIEQELFSMERYAILEPKVQTRR